mmetsp:Transcript_71263/g.180425  ORF Transcript_71263/g.180425 Transcript_71263/m.180425 type:complete len:226 (+) Transcript_71263:638-1315(+)
MPIFSTIKAMGEKHSRRSSMCTVLLITRCAFVAATDGKTRPGQSHNVTPRLCNSNVWMCFVFPGVRLMPTRFDPTSALITVLLPTFGYPTKPIVPRRSAAPTMLLEQFAASFSAAAGNLDTSSSNNPVESNTPGSSSSAPGPRGGSSSASSVGWLPSSASGFVPSSARSSSMSLSGMGTRAPSTGDDATLGEGNASSEPTAASSSSSSSSSSASSRPARMKMDAL